MHCPSCQSTQTKVLDSRKLSEGVKRRRQCSKCSNIYFTMEVLLSKKTDAPKPKLKKKKSWQDFMKDRNRREPYKRSENLRDDVWDELNGGEEISLRDLGLDGKK